MKSRSNRSRPPAGARPSAGAPGARPSPIRIVDVLTVVSLLAAGAVLVGKVLEEERAELRYPPVRAATGADLPIGPEEGPFRVSAADLAIDPGFRGDFGAHPRTLDMYRRLRAYPGAPPRIPHGLTDAEYRETACNGCHERGGWAARYGAFAPVSPHAEWSGCLQCHVPRDELVGVARPASEDALVCDQCHLDVDAEPLLFVDSDWRAGLWPELDRPASEGAPHAIPHEVRTRSNCLACHGGPAAVQGLRTDHPERASCRQCHLAVHDGQVGEDPSGMEAPS